MKSILKGAAILFAYGIFSIVIFIVINAGGFVAPLAFAAMGGNVFSVVPAILRLIFSFALPGIILYSLLNKRFGVPIFALASVAGLLIFSNSNLLSGNLSLPLLDFSPFNGTLQFYMLIIYGLSYLIQRKWERLQKLLSAELTLFLLVLIFSLTFSGLYSSLSNKIATKVVLTLSESPMDFLYYKEGSEVIKLSGDGSFKTYPSGSCQANFRSAYTYRASQNEKMSCAIQNTIMLFDLKTGEEKSYTLDKSAGNLVTDSFWSNDKKTLIVISSNYDDNVTQISQLDSNALTVQLLYRTAYYNHVMVTESANGNLAALFIDERYDPNPAFGVVIADSGRKIVKLPEKVIRDSSSGYDVYIHFIGFTSDGEKLLLFYENQMSRMEQIAVFDIESDKLAFIDTELLSNMFSDVSIYNVSQLKQVRQVLTGTAFNGRETLYFATEATSYQGIIRVWKFDLNTGAEPQLIKTVNKARYASVKFLNQGEW